MTNIEYSNLVFHQSVLTNKKIRSKEEDQEINANAKRLTDMELEMDAKDIIASIRHAFQHIPEREQAA